MSHTPYTGVPWTNKPSTASPINATNLEIMDNELIYLDNAVSDLKSDSTFSGEIIATQADLSTGRMYSVPNTYPTADGKLGKKLASSSNSSSYYTENLIDVSAYIGKSIKFEVNQFASSSVRGFGLCDENHIITASFREKDAPWVLNEDGKYEIIAFINAKYVYFSFQKSSAVRINIWVGEYKPFNISNNIYFNKYDIVKVLNQINTETSGTYYVATNGSDSTGTGDSLSPFATVNKALESGANTILLSAGVYEQKIDMSLAKVPIITINKITKDGRVIFKNPNCVIASSEESVSGYTNVKKASYTRTNLSANNTWVFQDNVPDATTLISDADRLPQQRGYEYRCEDTKIERCTSTALNDALTEIETANEYKFYLDTTNNIIYFSRPQTVSTTNPLCAGSGDDNLFVNASANQTLILNGIETKYMGFNLNNTINSRVNDCKSANSVAAGAFTYDSCLNICFIKCEATRCARYDSGDGFNGHSSNTGEIYSKQTTATLIDCWSHDNNDDGYSDHERSETSVFGGLYEYNKKGGVVPAYGSHCSCYNTVSRNNYTGFFYTGTSIDYGKYGQMLCVDCIAENNTNNGAGAGFRVSGDGNIVKLIGCKSIGNDRGYQAGDGTSMFLIDCCTLNNTTVKQGSSHISVSNTTIVT